MLPFDNPCLDDGIPHRLELGRRFRGGPELQPLPFELFERARDSPAPRQRALGRPRLRICYRHDQILARAVALLTERRAADPGLVQPTRARPAARPRGSRQPGESRAIARRRSRRLQNCLQEPGRSGRSPVDSRRRHYHQKAERFPPLPLPAEPPSATGRALIATEPASHGGWLGGSACLTRPAGAQHHDPRARRGRSCTRGRRSPRAAGRMTGVEPLLAYLDQPQNRSNIASNAARVSASLRSASAISRAVRRANSSSLEMLGLLLACTAVSSTSATRR